MFGYHEQTRLAEYVRHRLEQLEEERRIIEAFESKHNLDPYRYINDLSNILRELETPNANADKERNVLSLTPLIFWDDLWAILQGRELPLPDSLLEIQPYLDELERQRIDNERRLQKEREIQESKRALELRRQREAYEKARKQEELCEQLGISPKALAKLQAEE